jgi:F-type H+-transporting ATPase subunit delta
MSFQHLIARRYAKGLMMASEMAKLDMLALELKDMVLMIDGHKDLGRVFLDPAFSPIDRKKVIDGIAQKTSMMPVLHDFLQFLVDKGRFSLLSLIYEEFGRFIDEQMGRVRANITSASPLSEQETSLITQALAALSKKMVSIDAVIDASLLGGIRIDMAGTIIDGTVLAKLDAMKSQLVNSQRV